MAAPGHFGAMPAPAADPDAALAGSALLPAPMPFEQPGMSFPGSAFYHLADPPERTALVALPDTDPLAAPDLAPGAALDPGPAAAPFLYAGAQNGRALECLAQAVWYEAASESPGGQRAVAQVVLNRVRHSAWPNSVCGVVYEGSARAAGCQFTFTCDGSLARKAAGASWTQAMKIAREALSGHVYAPVGLATHYHTLWVSPYWAASLDPVGTIGAHRFYRSRGEAGGVGAFGAPYAGSEPAARAKAPDTAVSSSSSRRDRAPVPATPVQSAKAQAIAATPPAALPGVGAVKPEYASAGRWKADPQAPTPHPVIAAQPLD